MTAAERYRSNPEVRERVKARSRAQARAHSRLIRNHPSEWNMLYRDELAREGLR